MVNFDEQPHPWIEHRHQHKPPAVNDARVGFNGRVGLWITEKVGTMWCAYLFAALSLISLPAAILSGNVIVIVAWIAQTFFQLVLLPVIIVGQNIQATASDERAAQNSKGAEAVLRERRRVQ